MSESLSFFTDLAFPVAVAAFLLVVTTRKIDQMQTTLLKLTIYVGLIMGDLGISVPDEKLRSALELIRPKKRGGGG